MEIFTDIRILPLINGKLLSTFNADMVDYSVGDIEYNDGYIYPPSATFPISTQGKMGLRKITFVLDVTGDNRMTMESRINKIKKQLIYGADIMLPDGYHYESVYKEASEPEEVAPWILQVKFTMMGIRRTDIRNRTLTETGIVENIGDYEAPAILKISLSGTATVAGITITGQTGTVIIDGYKKTVKNGNQNVFSSTNLTEFPKLAVGNNNITISGECSQVIVSYYPLYF